MENAPQDHQVPRARRVNKDLLDLRVRLDHLENQALRDNLALSALLDRLENVIVNAREYWFQKTTLLKWMIIILGLIVLDRLLSLSPQIAEIAQKLL
jgi:hypothetical protein